MLRKAAARTGQRVLAMLLRQSSARTLPRARGCPARRPIVHYDRNALIALSTCRSADSRAFADGQVKAQMTPDGA